MNSQGPNSQDRWDHPEGKILEKLSHDFAEHRALAIRIHNLMVAVVRERHRPSSTTRPGPLMVATVLMTRLQNDLRVLSLVALGGFPAQAGTIAATIYETSFTLSYIGANEQRAQEWIDHHDPTRTFRSIHHITEASVLQSKRSTQRDVDADYGIYSQLCMARHANPLYQRFDAINQNAFGFEIGNGPTASDNAERAITFAIEHGIRLCIHATRSFIDHFVKVDRRTTFPTTLAAIIADFNALAMKSMYRFGDGDPQNHASKSPNR